MNKIIKILLTILIITSCNYTQNITYNDPNYLKSDEFINYEEIKSTKDTYSQENKNVDSSEITMNEYENHYYDSYSSRIRRFHRPMIRSNYYGSIYSDYFWYNHDPFYYGTNFYYSYNDFYSPIYPYYSYYNYFYTPYYYGNYYSFYRNRINNYSYLNDYNTTIKTSTGHRGSLTSKKNTIKRNFSQSSNLHKNSRSNHFRKNENSPNTNRYQNVNENKIKNKPNSNNRSNSFKQRSSKKQNGSYQRSTNKQSSYSNKVNRSYNRSNKNRKIKPR